MNVGILLLGLLGASIVGVGLGLRAHSERRTRRLLAAEGVEATARITDVRPVGRYNSERLVTVEVPGGSFRQTLPGVAADRSGAVVGAEVAVHYLPSDPSSGRLMTDEPEPGMVLPVVMAAFVAGLGALAAVTL